MTTILPIWPELAKYIPVFVKCEFVRRIFDEDLVINIRLWVQTPNIESYPMNGELQKKSLPATDYLFYGSSGHAEMNNASNISVGFSS